MATARIRRIPSFTSETAALLIVSLQRKLVLDPEYRIEWTKALEGGAECLPLDSCPATLCPDLTQLHRSPPHQTQPTTIQVLPARVTESTTPTEGTVDL
eukprot:6178755-Amphidinium_carterae.1